MILPFIERNDIYKSVGNSGLSPNSVFVTTFVCPSSPPETQIGPTLAYAGNCTFSDPVNATRSQGVMLDTTNPTSGRLAMDEIASNDGTAFTLLLSEKCGPGTAASPLIQSVWVPVMRAESGYVSAAGILPVFGMHASPPPRVINSGSAAVPGFWSQPSSNHPGGAVAAFCDGHVEFLRNSLQPRVYAQLLYLRRIIELGIKQPLFCKCRDELAGHLAFMFR